MDARAKHQKQAIAAIEKIGKEFYQKKTLAETLSKVGAATKEDLFKNNIALKFFLYYEFMRGRADELSEKYIECASKVIDSNPDLFQKNIGDVKIKRSGYKISYWKVSKGSFLERYVEEVNSEGIKVNPADLILLKSISTLLNELKESIVKFTIDEIKKNEIGTVYEKLRSYPMIKDKTISFFLRDCVTLFHIKINKEINKGGLHYVLPVDRWVRQVSQKMWGIDTDVDIKRKIISEASNPILFNQGAWYAGKHSFELLFDYIIGAIRFEDNLLKRCFYKLKQTFI